MKIIRAFAQNFFNKYRDLKKTNIRSALSYFVLLIVFVLLSLTLFNKELNGEVIHIQTAGSITTGTSVTTNLSSTQEGSLIVVCLGPGINNSTSVVDNRSNNYILASRFIAPNDARLEVYYSYSSTGNVTTVTANFPYTSGAIMSVSEYSGINTVNPLDVFVSNNNGYNGGVNWTSGATTTIGSNDLLYGCARDIYGTGVTYVSGQDFTPRITNGSMFVQDKIVSSIGSYESFGTISGPSGYNIIASMVAFKIDTPSDTTPPSTPQNLNATAISSSRIDLSWSTSTDNVLVSGYKIYRDNSLINTTSNTNYSDTSLNSNTSYTYAVSAIDSSNNESARSASSTASTLNVDITNPSVSISNLTNNQTVSGVINIGATAEDNVSIAGVKFYLDNSVLGEEDLVEPYSISWNSQNVVNGNHSIFAVARDTSNNYATSSLVSIIVANSQPVPVVVPPPQTSRGGGGGGGIRIITTSSPSVLLYDYINTDLYLGLSSADVISLKRFLFNKGLLNENHKNYFDSETLNAVMRYQCLKKIVCEGDSLSTGWGYVGPKTRKVINDEISSSGLYSYGGYGNEQLILKIKELQIQLIGLLSKLYNLLMKQIIKNP